MFLDNFYNQNQSELTISAEQGSSFAKTISNDFNPIHDPDSKRFCVPGDLLFALVLQRYGLSQNMSFSFAGMVARDTGLLFPSAPGNQFEIVDGRDKMPDGPVHQYVPQSVYSKHSYRRVFCWSNQPAVIGDFCFNKQFKVPYTIVFVFIRANKIFDAFN